MSAGHDTHSLVPVATIADYPAAFRVAVEAGLLKARDAGADPVVFESWRSADLQELYWHRGRDVHPPAAPVTYARSQLESWHGFGLAVDVISTQYRWFVPPTSRPTPEQIGAWAEMREKFFRIVSGEMIREGLTWGGAWRRPDPPHFQWGRCPASPTDADRALFTSQGVEAVWDRYGAR